MEILFLLSLIINIILLAVIITMTSANAKISDFRQAIRHTYRLQHHSVRPVRYVMELKAPSRELSEGYIEQLYMTRDTRDVPPQYPYHIKERLIKAFTDKLQEELIKDERSILIDWRRDGYDFYFRTTIEFALIPQEHIEHYLRSTPSIVMYPNEFFPIKNNLNN